MQQQYQDQGDIEQVLVDASMLHPADRGQCPVDQPEQRGEQILACRIRRVGLERRPLAGRSRSGDAPCLRVPRKILNKIRQGLCEGGGGVLHARRRPGVAAVPRPCRSLLFPSRQIAADKEQEPITNTSSACRYVHDSRQASHRRCHRLCP